MFRFSIRDVLWLTALVAMGVGWYANSREGYYRGQRDMQSAMESIAKREGYTYWSSYDGIHISLTKDTINGMPRP